MRVFDCVGGSFEPAAKIPCKTLRTNMSTPAGGAVVSALFGPGGSVGSAGSTGSPGPGWAGSPGSSGGRRSKGSPAETVS